MLIPSHLALSTSINQMWHKRMRETVGLQHCLYSTESLSQWSPDSQASISFVVFLLVQTFPSLFHVTFSICIPSDDPSLLLLKHFSSSDTFIALKNMRKPNMGLDIESQPPSAVFLASSVTAWPEWSSSSCSVQHHQTMEQAETRD